jgi:ribosomal protein S12 methylthiotransferase accessory factor
VDGVVTAPTPTLDSLEDPPLPDADEGLARARRLVSPRTGLIREVVYAELAPDDPPLHWAQAIPADAQAAGGRMALSQGGAVSADRDRAVLKAVGESVERYCSAQWEEDALTTATHEELGTEAVSPDEFALFASEQYDEPGFRWSPFRADTTVRWAMGTSLVTGEAKYVPAAFVYVPYGKEPGSGPIWMPISSGLACAPSLARAMYRAALELIERDAFMIVWQNRLTRPRIDLGSIEDPLVQRLLAAWEGLPVRCHAVVLTLDIQVTVILGILTSESGRWPLTVVGLGVDISPRRALTLALEELAQGFIGMRRVAAQAPDWRPAEDYRDVDTVTRHGHAHAVEERLRPTIEFLLRGELVDIDELPDRSTDSSVASLRIVVDDLSSLGLDAVAVDLTTEDVDAAGFKVVRVVIPGLQPLDVNHTTQYLGGRRLYELPWRLGLRDAPTQPSELNPYPHPFP